MIASLAGSFVIMSCLGCTTPPSDSDVIRLEVGPVEGAQAFTNSTSSIDSIFASSMQTQFRLPLTVGNSFSPSNFARPLDAARFEALDLSTPMPVRTTAGNLWTAEVSFGASAAQTGLGLDLSFTPRAQLQRDQAGNNVARTGAEFRMGPNLVDRDLRGTGAASPSWYFFVGADNEALVWNVADRRSMDGLTLNDQATVGDLQAGLAWSIGKASQMSFGLVERELEFNDLTGDNDVKRKDRFAAFSFTLRN
jgi:hypothetical protein